MVQVMKDSFFDSKLSVGEQLPREFVVNFEEVGKKGRGEVKVTLVGNRQIGDIINDNSYEDDFYRYHDVFHYSFATLLNWSPCTRAMMKRKRKSNPVLDEVEDGARAIITEEALSMIIFNEAKRNKYYEGKINVSKKVLSIVKEMTENFEVRVKTKKEWQEAILKAYEIFRMLMKNEGGRVTFNAFDKTIYYSLVK